MRGIAVLLVIVSNVVCMSNVIAQSSSTFNNDMAIQTGNSQAINGTGNTQSINFSGGNSPLPYAPPVALQQASAPALFQMLPNQAGLPAEVVGWQLDMAYVNSCKPRVGKGKLAVVKQEGDSGMTTFVFSGHQNMKKQGSATPEIEVDLSGKGTFECLGKVTISATPKAAKEFPLDMSVIVSDLMNSLGEVLSGVEGQVVLLSHPSFWAGGVGVSSGANGFSLGTGIFNAVSALTGLTVAPGITNTNGSSFPNAKIGMSFIVAKRMKQGDPGAVDININPAPMQNVQPLGGNGIKSEAK